MAGEADVIGAADLLREAAEGIVHDLGNLIQIAASAIAILSRSPRLKNDETLQPILGRARSSLEQAGALVHQTMGRPAGPSTIVRSVPEPVDIRQGLAEIGDLIASLCEPQILLSIQTEDGMPPVACNRLDFQNAVLNLVINARDALPDGGTIIVAASRVDDDTLGEAIDLQVMDDGHGMDAATLLRALTPRFTTKAAGRGSGLGLAMVKRFADDTGGSVGLASQVGMGATVCVRIPTIADARPRPPSRPMAPGPA